MMIRFAVLFVLSVLPVAAQIRPPLERLPPLPALPQPPTPEEIAELKRTHAAFLRARRETERLVRAVAATTNAVPMDQAASILSSLADDAEAASAGVLPEGTAPAAGGAAAGATAAAATMAALRKRALTRAAAALAPCALVVLLSSLLITGCATRIAYHKTEDGYVIRQTAFGEWCPALVPTVWHVKTADVDISTDSISWPEFPDIATLYREDN